MPRKEPLLNSYYKLLRDEREKFACPKCNEALVALQFERHAKICQDLDPELECAWCSGKTKWPKGEKGLNEKHLRQCFTKCHFRKPIPLPTPPRYSYNAQAFTNHSSLSLFENEETFTPSSSLFKDNKNTFVLDNARDMCPEKGLFGRSRLSDIPRLSYQLFSLLELSILPVPFQNENVNKAARCVRTFFDIRDTHDFYHCMVRAVAMPQFIKAMQADKGRTFMLPFSCLCDGGDYEDPKHLHHRHFIIVSPKNHFKKHVWKHVAIPRKDIPLDRKTGKPMTNFHCCYHKQIKKPMHLINAIGYVSNRKSRCNGTLDKKSKKNAEVKENHYFIFTALPTNYRLFLMLQWDGGIMQYIHNVHQHLHPKVLVPLCSERKGGRVK